MVQHKAPHRNWMPAPRHLSLYADQILPEPATLFDDYQDNVHMVAKQEMEIDRHMDLQYDLFLSHPSKGIKGQNNQSVDRSSQRSIARMTPEQRKAWDGYYGPKNEAFLKSKPSGKDLVRWKYQRYLKNYLRCVRGVDESVARLMQELETLGLGDNTIVIYSSDQGFYLGDHGWYDKRWMYEESLQMPFIIKWPGVIKPGSSSESLIQNIDYGPTFLDAAGVAVPGDMQGLSMLPLLKGLKGESPANWRDSIYYHYYEYPSVHMVPRQYGIRTKRYKLIHFYQFDQWELLRSGDRPRRVTQSLREKRACRTHLPGSRSSSRPCENITMTAPIFPPCLLTGKKTCTTAKVHSAAWPTRSSLSTRPRVFFG